MRRRFFWGTVAVAIVTLLIGGVTASVLVARSVASTERDEFLRQAEATGRLIQTQLERSPDGTAAEQMAQLSAVLRAAEAIGGHDYLEAFVSAPRFELSLPQGAALLPRLPDLRQTERGATYDVDVGGESVTALALPLQLGADRRAVVVVGRTEPLVPWRVVFGRFLVAVAAAIVLASLLAVVLSRWLGRRLDGLAAASAAIAGGDLGARAPAAGKDEVAAVARSFNEMAEQLEDARRRERDFLMSVSHDLRTPLTTIRGYAEGLADDAIPADDLPRVGGVLHAQADRLSRLVDDLVQLSRLEARQFTLRPEPVDLAAHLKEVAEAMRARADAARVRLDLALTAVGVVEVDADRVAQVAGNLLENALRYTPESGTVTLSLTAGRDEVAFTVADTGPGIDEADLPHVFERLYVAQRYRAVRPEGSGLGLTIVRELVAAMGGRLAVTSRPGAGTAVTVTLRR